MKEFIIGSKAFFSAFPDFVPVDTDYLIMDDNPDFELTKSYMEGNIHYVYWEDLPKEKLIEAHLHFYEGRYIQKFLVPEFAEYIGLTIDDLRSLSILVDRLDQYHGYCRVVYNAYLENGSFTLTPEQLQQAYEVYKSERGEYYQK